MINIGFLLAAIALGAASSVVAGTVMELTRIMAHPAKRRSMTAQMKQGEIIAAIERYMRRTPGAGGGDDTATGRDRVEIGSPS